MTLTKIKNNYNFKMRSINNKLTIGNVINQSNYKYQSIRCMADNPNEIKKRIVSTKSIMKITKSMKMVSAAKLKQDEKRLIEGRVFGQCFNMVLGSKVSTLEELSLGKSELQKDESTLHAVITSDRGLCGGVNSSVAKATRFRSDAITNAGKQSSIFIVGVKGEGALRRTHGKRIVQSVDETWKTPMNFAKSSAVASRILRAAGDAKKIDVIYNSFKSAIVYITTVKSIPNFPAMFKSSGDDAIIPSPIDQYELEPELASEAIQNLAEFSLAASIYGAAIENATSEQSARMAAMDNAVSYYYYFSFTNFTFHKKILNIVY